MRRQWRERELAGRRPKSVREASEERLGGVRRAIGSRPGGVRGASGRRPRSARELSERRPNCVPKASVATPGPHLTKVASPCGLSDLFGQNCQLTPCVDDCRDGAFSTAGAMDVHDVAKPPRLCNKLKTAAPVHTQCTGHCETVLRTRVLSLDRAFAPCLCSKRQWASSPNLIKPESERCVSINRCD